MLRSFLVLQAFRNPSVAPLRLRALASMASPSAQRRLKNPVLLICDLQEKFRPAIYEYPKVIATASKVIRAATILSIPIHSTTQSASKLGPLCSELLPLLHTSDPPHDKTLFSMALPALLARLPPPPAAIALLGIETHICVTQTTLDLLEKGYRVYVLADGVSSCNQGEIGVALRRLAAEGARVVSSEGWIYECMGDAGIAEFREIAKLVRDTKDETRGSVEALCKI